MKQKITQYIITSAIIFISALSSAQVYRTTDEHGNIKFTDRPRPTAEAERVHIEPINTARAIELPVEESSQLDVVDEEAIYYTQLEIVSPANDTSFPNRLVPTPVVTRVTPELKPGHTLHLLLNGTLVSSGSSTHLEIPTLNVGTQSLQVEILAGDKVLVKSAPVTIHGFQPGGSNRGSSGR